MKKKGGRDLKSVRSRAEEVSVAGWSPGVRATARRRTGGPRLGTALSGPGPEQGFAGRTLPSRGPRRAALPRPETYSLPAPGPLPFSLLLLQRRPNFRRQRTVEPVRNQRRDVEASPVLARALPRCARRRAGGA